MSKSTLLAALGGGVVGAGLTAAIILAAAPTMMGERLVRQSLVEHPDILVEASDALRLAEMKPILDQNRDAMETAFASSAMGASAEDAEVVMVEFYDYACGYCRQAKPDIEKLIEENPGLRVVFRELPVLGPDSVIAARASLAASKAGKFDQFHEAMWAAGRPSEASITEALEAVDMRLEDIADPAFEAEINQNFELANALGASGTPLFVVGDTIIPSAEGYSAYKAAIEKAREDA